MASPPLLQVRLYRMDLPAARKRWLASRPPTGWPAPPPPPRCSRGRSGSGGYSELAARLGTRPESAEFSYATVIAVFATAALMDLAMLKLMDVEAFAAGFRKYDLLTQRWPTWGHLYPGVELPGGLGILRRPEMAGVARLIGVTALLLGGMGMGSVGKAVFIDRLALNGACVVRHSRGPLGVVSFTENLNMALMGAVMLVAGCIFRP